MEKYLEDGWRLVAETKNGCKILGRGFDRIACYPTGFEMRYSGENNLTYITPDFKPLITRQNINQPNNITNDRKE